ncbi:ferrous iron transport protein A [Kitasatospora sp. NPDC001683]
MPTDDEFADGFARALRGAAELAPEPVQHALAAQAEQRGRRRRRHRRAAVASALAVLVLAGAGGFAAVGRYPFGASGPATLPPPGLPTMSSQELVTLVTGLLPKGTVEEQSTTKPGKISWHQTDATLLFDDGAGASVVRFTVERTNLPPEASAVCMDGFQTPQDSCDRTVRPDGSVLVIDKLRSEHIQGGREWRVTLATPGGRRIAFTEFNGQPARANRPSPPLDDAQLTALVTSPAWDPVFATLAPVEGAPQSGDSPTPSASTPSNPELLAKLVPLLPPGAKVEGQAPGHAALTVTFEGRTSMLQIGVDPASPLGRKELASMGLNPETPLEVREKRPDGTLVVTNRFGNGKTATNPVLHWTAAVHYPDGSQVRLSEWNGENGYTFNPGDPALDLDRLKAIVTAPAWHS